jgi:hypothetical protein
MNLGSEGAAAAASAEQDRHAQSHTNKRGSSVRQENLHDVLRGPCFSVVAWIAQAVAPLTLQFLPYWFPAVLLFCLFRLLVLSVDDGCIRLPLDRGHIDDIRSGINGGGAHDAVGVGEGGVEGGRWRV